VHDPLSTSPLPRHFLQPHTVAHCHLIHAPKFAIKKQGPTKRIIDDSIILKALCCISGCISTRSFQRLNILGQESLSSRAADVSQNPSTSGWVLLRPKSRPHIDTACPPPYYDRLPTASPLGALRLFAFSAPPLSIPSSQSTTRLSHQLNSNPTS